MPYHHILVAVDLTEECDPVIHRARELSVSNGAKLSLVHIVEPMAMAFGGDVPMDLSQLQQQQFDQAKEQTCDLIVVGSHGRHGLALLLGSTANDVLHGAPCDVLAVRLIKS